jgi:hypothetical protein
MVSTMRLAGDAVLSLRKFAALRCAALRDAVAVAAARAYVLRCATHLVPESINS